MLLYVRLIFQFSSFDLPVIITKEHLSVDFGNQSLVFMFLTILPRYLSVAALD